MQCVKFTQITIHFYVRASKLCRFIQHQIAISRAQRLLLSFVVFVVVFYYKYNEYDNKYIPHSLTAVIVAYLEIANYNKC